MTTNSVFNIASMTKAITGTAAMQLVEQGKLALDEPISRYIPRAAELKVLEGVDEKGEPRLRPPRREVTLRHLMTHTSGMVYNQWDADFDRFVKARNFPILASGHNEAFYAPLMFDPGERWEYGIAIDWIGLLVETISARSLGTYMQENIFSPLGMTSTGYRLTPDMEARRVATHQRAPDGKLTEVEWKGQPQPVRENGGGGLYSTAGDYLQFVRMILNGGRGNGNQVLKPETVALMGKNAMGDTRVVMLKTTESCPLGGCGVLPGSAEELGAHLHDQRATSPDRPLRRQPCLGWSLQHLLLDRSVQGHGRRVHGPGPSVRRPEDPAGLLRLRDRRLSDNKRLKNRDVARPRRRRGAHDPGWGASTPTARMRRITIEPGGQFALHDHRDRPGLFYVQEGPSPSIRLVIPIADYRHDARGLLSRVPVPPDNIYAVPTDNSCPSRPRAPTSRRARRPHRRPVRATKARARGLAQALVRLRRRGRPHQNRRRGALDGLRVLEGEGPTRWSKGTRPSFRVALIEAQRKAGTLARFGVRPQAGKTRQRGSQRLGGAMPWRGTSGRPSWRPRHVRARQYADILRRYAYLVPVRAVPSYALRRKSINGQLSVIRLRRDRADRDRAARAAVALKVSARPAHQPRARVSPR